MFYILDDDDNPVHCGDGSAGLVRMTRWFAAHEHKRRIAADEPAPGIYVSTVFLGVDHNYWGIHDAPIVFETMLFNDYGPMDQRRYATKAEALAGHAAMVREVAAAVS